MEEKLIIVATGLFILLITFRIIRDFIRGRQISAVGARSSRLAQYHELNTLLNQVTSQGKAREILREIERMAVEKKAVERAVYHCAAGELALAKMKRPNVAVRFFLRALRDDPTCIPAFERLREILTAQKRFKRFEKTCWEILGRLEDDEVGYEMWSKCWSGLATIYTFTPKLVRRADAIRKMMAALEEDYDELENDNKVTGLANPL